MPWVQRDASKNISGAFANQQPGYADEFLPDDNPALVAFLNPPKPQTILSQDLMAQFTTADLTAIKSAIDANIQFWGLWNALTTQKDPMIVNNARFLSGWGALVQVLGQSRMDAIATALGVTVG
jgi:hypothetical protein